MKMNMLFPWKEEYEVGVKNLDDEHRRLVGYLNDLYASMKAGKGMDALKAVLSQLVHYTDTHFASEESLMKLNGYEGFKAHKEKHEKMAGHVRGLVRKFDVGDITSPIQITNFLKDWLSRHILETDKAYGPFLRSKGVQ
jgi:hemerythrin